MKTRRFALPATIMFAMFLGSTTISAQSNYAVNESKILNIESLQPKKNVGLDYEQTISELNSVLKHDVDYSKADTYKGAIDITIQINPRGEVSSIAYSSDTLPTALKEDISTTLKNQVYRPVTINGVAKNQSFKIPLSIK